MKIDENNIFTVLTIGSSVLLALLAACGLIFISASFAIGVVAGGIAAIANSHWLYRTLQRVMGLPAPQAVRFAQVRYALRLALLAIIVAILISYFKINILGLLLGLSVLVITIIAVTVYLATLNGG